MRKLLAQGHPTESFVIRTHAELDLIDKFASFIQLLEKHELAPKILLTINAGLAAQGLILKTGTLVDATLIAAPSSTKNNTGRGDPEMYQTKKGNQWYFGMKAHIGLDAESGLVPRLSARLPM